MHFSDDIAPARSPRRVRSWHRLILLLLCLINPAVQADFEPLTDFAVDPVQTGRLSRTLSLLRSSNPTNRPVVRVVFYGQSITIYPWWQEVAATLRSTYPYVRFDFQNLAISGFMADRLAQACVYDVVPAQPDLVILHAYGWEPGFNALLGRLRAGTTADILVQRDHPLTESELMEETDPAKLEGTNPATWEYKNYVWLPRQVDAHGCALADVRGYWKRYCRIRNRFTRQLLSDQTHPNEEGNHVMAAAVLAYLLPSTPTVPVDPWGGPRATQWEHPRDPERATHRLSLRFKGTRVDAVMDRATATSASVRIDGRAPSNIPEIRGFRRASPVPGFPWPAITIIESQAPRLPETWTLTVTRLADTNSIIEFRVHGSETGFDGEGSNRTNFVSLSGRVVIPSSTWLLGYALNVSGAPLPADYRIRWNCEWVGMDELVGTPPAEPGAYAESVLAAGLPDGVHVLELEGAALAGLRALRIYRPSGGAELQLVEQVIGPEPLHLRIAPAPGGLLLRPLGGEAGTQPMLETSTDLIHWQEIGRVPPDTLPTVPNDNEPLRVFRLRGN